MIWFAVVAVAIIVAIAATCVRRPQKRRRRFRVRSGYEVVPHNDGGYHVVLSPSYEAKVGDCSDCRHFRGYVHWWCVNDAAVSFHGTNLPTKRNCQFWDEAERWTS